MPSERIVKSVEYQMGYKDGFIEGQAEGLKIAQDVLAKSTTPSAPRVPKGDCEPKCQGCKQIPCVCLQATTQQPAPRVCVKCAHTGGVGKDGLCNYRFGELGDALPNLCPCKCVFAPDEEGKHNGR